MKRRKIAWKWEDPEAQQAFAQWVGFGDEAAAAEQVDKVEAILGLRPPLDVLDLGCGTGRHALEMVRTGYRVTAIDVAQSYIEHGKREAGRLDLDIELRLQRGRGLFLSPPFEKGGLGGIYPTMIKYDPKLKEGARRLRAQMTDSERALWARLRRKQVQSVQFYTQKPIGNYIVDFYAPKAKLVIEVDGSQHKDCEHTAADSPRDAYLGSEGLTVLRFDNLQVLNPNPPKDTDGRREESGGGVRELQGK